MGCPVVEMGEVLSRHWPDRVGPAVLLVLSLGLASCAVTPKSAPAPVEDRVSRPAPPLVPEPDAGPPASGSEPAVLPEPQLLPAPPAAPGRPGGAAPARPPAVVALLDRVDSAAATGDSGQAAAELERALRISPRDGDLWLRLARVRLQQRQWQQAETMALKCVSLPESDAATRQAAWSLIGSARAARGDHSGAAAARQREAAIPAP